MMSIDDHDDHDDHDERERRCPQLGHDAPFSYCRTMAEGLPCRRVVDCWQGYFDVASYVRDHYSPEQIQAIFTPPQPKITSILEMIDRAKKASDQTDEPDP